MSQLKYTLDPRTPSVIIHGGSYIASVPLAPGVHSADIVPSPMISVAVNASAAYGEGWTLKYSIDGVDQTPTGPITGTGNAAGTANHQSTRPLLP